METHEGISAPGIVTINAFATALVDSPKADAEQRVTFRNPLKDPKRVAKRLLPPSGKHHAGSKLKNVSVVIESGAPPWQVQLTSSPGTGGPMPRGPTEPPPRSLPENLLII